MAAIQAVFIDRDGTIGSVLDKTIRPLQTTFFPGVEEAIRKLKERGIFVFAFTNQAVVAKGQATRDEIEAELTAIGFDRVYLCPHDPKAGCSCRKPAPGMLLQAARENNLALNDCVVIGDRWKDLLAAQAAGCIKVLVRTGDGQQELDKYDRGQYSGKYLDAYPNYIAADIHDAVNWILGE